MTECAIPSMDYRTLIKRLVEQAGQDRLPYFGTIEITPYCNLKCVHCYIANGNLKSNILTRAELCRILDEIAAEGCLELILTGGEPLFRNDFLDIYTHAKQKGMFITVFTNGTLLTPEVARYFREWPPQSVEITIYGATPAVHESVTGVPGSFARSLKGIKLLLKEGVTLKLKTVIMTLNKHELPAMKQLAEDLGVPFRFDPILNPGLDGSRQPCELRITPREVVELDVADPKRCEGWMEAYRLLPKLSPPRDTVYTCGAGTSQFHIDAYGGLQPCIIARQHSYDLRKGSFREGWRDYLPGVVLQKPDQPSRCRSCQYRATCVVCPGWAHLEYGTSIEQPIEYLCEIERRRAAVFATPPGPTVDSPAASINNALSRPRVRDIPPENRAESDFSALERRWSP
jgi:radical SAM protein with 4Fe4S-binding SPASM domain